MISDKERSEVAKAFRSVAKVTKRREGSRMPDLCAAWMALSTAIKGRIAFCDTSDVFDALADLIEPSFHCDEYKETDFITNKTNIVRKAYVVSILDNERPQDACEIPMWLYSNWEAARKKAREYTEGNHDNRNHDNPFRWAIVNEVEVMGE